MPIHPLSSGSLYYADRRVSSSPYPPMILIHGAGGSHLDWPPALRRLPQTRVIALDLPGHGRSPQPAHADTRCSADVVCRLIDSLGIPGAIITGHSMGGAVAQHIAFTRPDLTAGLILLGTGSKLPVDPALPQRAIEDPVAVADWIIEQAWHSSAPAEIKRLARQRLLATLPETLRADLVACQSFDLRDRIATINAPTLVIGAGGDRMVRPAFSQTLAAAIPRATLVMLEDAGHMFPLERADRVAAVTTQWLKDHF